MQEFIISSDERSPTPPVILSESGCGIIFIDQPRTALSTDIDHVALDRGQAEKLLVALDLLLSTDDERNAIHDLVY